MTKPFWEYPPFENSPNGFIFNWSGAGIAQKGLAEGLQVHQYDKSGTLRSDIEIEKFIELFLAHEAGSRILYRSYANSKSATDMVYIGNAGWVVDISYITKNRTVSVTAYTTNEKHINSIRQLCLDHITRVVTRGKVYVVVSGEDGPKLQEMGVAGEDFIPTNYRPETVTDYRHVVADFNSNDPCGRIVILDGPPGTGKTHMVRALLNEAPKATFVLIPSNMLSQLGSPTFVRALLARAKKGYPMIIIIEDADECLASRKSDNVSEISALLNFSDGIFGAMIDMRIVATTNVEVHDLDDAVMRDGRLCRRIEVGKLDPDQATAVFLRLKPGAESPFKKGYYTLAEVYKAAKGGGGTSVAPKPSKKMGFAPPDAEPDEDEFDKSDLPTAIQAGYKVGDVVTTDEGDIIKVREDGEFEVVKLVTGTSDKFQGIRVLDPEDDDEEDEDLVDYEYGEIEATPEEEEDDD